MSGAGTGIRMKPEERAAKIDFIADHISMADMLDYFRAWLEGQSNKEIQRLYEYEYEIHTTIQAKGGGHA